MDMFSDVKGIKSTEGTEWFQYNICKDDSSSDLLLSVESYDGVLFKGTDKYRIKVEIEITEE